MIKIIRNWKVPSIILLLLILALIFRWGNLGSTTRNSTITKTSKDRWNNAVWQETISKDKYSETIISPSRFEALRKPVERQVQYEDPIYTIDNSNPYFKFRDITGYTTKTKTVQGPPDVIYWLSRDGLTKIWIYITLVISIWLITIIVLRNKSRMKI